MRKYRDLIFFVILTSIEGIYRSYSAMQTIKVWPDSERYRVDGALSPFFFWLGQGPGVLVQTINLLPIGMGIGVQAFLATYFWGLAALEASGGRLRWLLAINVLSLSPWFTVWDRSVLTEDLTISGIALFAAATARRNDKMMILGAAVVLLSRPMLFPLIYLVCNVHWIVNYKPRFKFGIIMASLLLFSGIQVGFFENATVQYSWMHRPASLTAIRAADRLVGRDHIPSVIPNAIAHGLPKNCALPTESYPFPFVWTDKAERDCPGLTQFLENGGTPFYSDILNDPIGMGSELLSITNKADYPGYYRDGIVRSQRTIDFIDSLMWSLVGLSLLSMFLVYRNKERFFCIFAGGIYAVIMWAVDGQEMWRHMLPCLAFVLVYAISSLNDEGLVKISRGKHAV